MKSTRNLVVVLGDQLNEDSAAFDGFDPALDTVWMAEVAQESTHVWSSKPRTALFLSAMRHFKNRLLDKGLPLHYVQLDDPGNEQSLAAELLKAICQHRPQRLVMVQAGDWRVCQLLEAAALDAGLDLEVREDRHFYATVEDFRRHCAGRKQLRLEFWYRELRMRFGVLVKDGAPVGGQWNFDEENRQSFPKSGPGKLPAPLFFPPDDITTEVLDLVEERFSGHPGALDSFAWPVTPEQAKQALDSFIEHRLPLFGKYEDAMWAGEPWLYHSQLSAAMNLKLLDPRHAVEAAEKAFLQGKAPLQAVEGFIRQILGWREYIRGMYWTRMPGYESANELQATEPLPAFFWNGATEMACLRDALGQTLRHGYAHHIQRLMVTGLYGLMLGVDPKQLHEWYLAVYVDAVEWVELPNTVGMSQFADGGVLASKPYVASGKYIDRMSNHCKQCPYNPAKSTGADACPYTTLYWDFLLRHRERLANNPRMALQLKNADKLSDNDKLLIRQQAQAHRQRVRQSDAAVPVVFYTKQDTLT